MVPKNYKSAPGTIEVDPKTHQIIVTDTFQNIKRMEMLVEVLDVGPEMRVYNLNNIGFKGEDVDKLSKAIEQDPESADALMNRGIAHMVQGRGESALDDLNRALSMAEDPARAYANIGTVYLRLEMYEIIITKLREFGYEGSIALCKETQDVWSELVKRGLLEDPGEPGFWENVKCNCKL